MLWDYFQGTFWIEKVFLGDYLVLDGPRLEALSQRPKHLAVMLHGYGASGDDLINLAAQWQENLPEYEFVSPHAPESCEINPVGYQWFGLRDFNPFNIRSGLDRARPLLKKFLLNEINRLGFMPEDLLLIGFSQGTMMALDAMFSFPGVRAILGYSGAFYPPVGETLKSQKPKVRLIHGDGDMVIPYPAMNEAARQLKLFGIEPELYTCEGLGHGIDEKGIRLGCEFLQDLGMSSLHEQHASGL